MDNQIVQPLRQFIVHIRSKDAEREGQLNSHLFIDLEEPIKINSINVRLLCFNLIYYTFCSIN